MINEMCEDYYGNEAHPYSLTIGKVVSLKVNGNTHRKTRIPALEYVYGHIVGFESNHKGELLIIVNWQDEVDGTKDGYITHISNVIVG